VNPVARRIEREKKRLLARGREQNEKLPIHDLSLSAKTERNREYQTQNDTSINSLEKRKLGKAPVERGEGPVGKKESGRTQK